MTLSKKEQRLGLQKLEIEKLFGRNVPQILVVTLARHFLWLGPMVEGLRARDDRC